MRHHLLRAPASNKQHAKLCCCEWKTKWYAGHLCWAPLPLSWQLASSLGSFKSLAKPCQIVWQCMAAASATPLSTSAAQAACGCFWQDAVAILVSPVHPQGCLRWSVAVRSADSFSIIRRLHLTTFFCDSHELFISSRLLTKIVCPMCCSSHACCTDHRGYTMVSHCSCAWACT